MGHDLQQARIAHLERLQTTAGIRRALLVGEGNGSFLLSFLLRFPNAEVSVIEASEVMVRRAQARLCKAGLSIERVTWIVSDLTDHSLKDESFDLIVTLFFFDNFTTDVAVKYYQQLASAAHPDAYWLIADFQIPATGWRKWRAKIWLNTLYGFFRIFAGLEVSQLPNYKAILKADNIECIALDKSCGDMLFSGLYRLH
ncbi:MAG: class I SAM-dependent methyltransferase [Opitutaceae bacterium]